MLHADDAAGLAALAIRKPVYDAAVVGAGIVGLAAAVALARDGRRIALVERSPPERVRGTLGFDLRSVALTPASVDFLCALGGVEEADLTPIEAMHVWEYDGSGSLKFEADGTLDSPHRADVRAQVGYGTAVGTDSERLGYSRGALGHSRGALGHSRGALGHSRGALGHFRDALAFVAENSLLTTRLWKVAGKCLDILPRPTVTGLTQGRDAVLLDGPDVAARLVVGADGADSIVRKLANAALRYEPPHRGGSQRAIATVARATRSHGNTAFQRFGRSGPVALLPLRDANEGDGPESEAHRTVSVIWSATETDSQRLKSLDDIAFRRALGEETESVLGDFAAVDRRLSFPVRQALAADFNPSPRILVIGDAARTLHPLAGQGVNVGLEDVRGLVAGAAHSDLGAPGLWRGFSRERRTRSKFMMASMRALLAAYCGPQAGNPWMRLARNAGVRFIDAAPGVKAQLIREAMGLGPLAVRRGLRGAAT